ncbi:MAG: hypothetical protein ACI90V_014410, partial [Bacillariaceae sp.]
FCKRLILCPKNHDIKQFISLITKQKQKQKQSDNNNNNTTIQIWV